MSTEKRSHIRLPPVSPVYLQLLHGPNQFLNYDDYFSTVDHTPTTFLTDSLLGENYCFMTFCLYLSLSCTAKSNSRVHPEIVLWHELGEENGRPKIIADATSTPKSVPSAKS